MNVMNYCITIFLFILCIHGYTQSKDILSLDQEKTANYLLLITIDGSIHLVNRFSGERLWSSALDPVTTTVGTNGSFLIANPLTGRLFMFHHTETREHFSGLEKSVFEYINMTPLRTDELVMNGSKRDYWVVVNMSTGKILHEYFSNAINNTTCFLYIGMSRYNLQIHLTNFQKIYEITLNSISTHTALDSESDDLRLYAASDSGLVAARYRRNGLEEGWSNMFNSTVIGFYNVLQKNELRRTHFTSMSHETLLNLFLTNTDPNKMSLKKAMYFGHDQNRWFVLNTYIQKTTQIKPLSRQKLPLIEGPLNSSASYSKNQDSSNSACFYNTPQKGFYEIPSEFKGHDFKDKKIPSQYQLEFERKKINAVVPFTYGYPYWQDIPTHDWFRPWLIFFTVVIGLILLGIFAILFVVSGKKERRRSSNSDSFTNEANEISIGDLLYYPKDVLGYGTNGTTVFRGVFKGNDKEVAVKRVIQSQQTQTELEFLRQSFDSNHLIKCFYITQSREFTYLALELCDCTLESYVDDNTFHYRTKLGYMTVVHQLMQGVHYLHEKGIIHRDLKPRNVLLMKQKSLNIRNQLRKSDRDIAYKVVITDFGLSKQSGEQADSITKTAVLGGTSGYIAPEFMNEEISRITPRADIFSCGILFYYIRTGGNHPFGSNVVSRQHNIHEGRYQLNKTLFEDSDFMMLCLIKRMLDSVPQNRPSSEEILKGPLFWKNLEKLSFLCDLSDCLENADAKLVRSIDQIGGSIFGERWIDHLDSEFLAHLSVQRTYKSKQLSHLIRAIRNKRNHFSEVPPDLSKRLFNGKVEGFARYIDKQFPKLYFILYEWVRCNMSNFPNLISTYSVGISNPFSFYDTIDVFDYNKVEEEEEEEDEEGEEEYENKDLPEWRRVRRRRPNQQKKQRGGVNRHKNSNRFSEV